MWAGVHAQGRRIREARVLLACNLTLITAGVMIAAWGLQLLGASSGPGPSGPVIPDQTGDNGQSVAAVGGTALAQRVAQLKAMGIAAVFAGIAIVVGGYFAIGVATQRRPVPS